MIFTQQDREDLRRAVTGIDVVVKELIFPNPKSYAQLLERYFLSRKDEEGVMFCQAIIKKLSKKRGRSKKNVSDNSPTSA